MPNDTVDLSNDIETARDQLAPQCQRLLGLIQLWNIFLSSKEMAKTFVAKYDKLEYQAKIAFTKGVIIDYAKPWTGNRSSALAAIKVGQNYPFLAATEALPLHAEMIELRHRLIAHIDEGYQGLGITVAGSTIKNLPPNRPQDEGTLDDVFLPAVVRLENTRGMWWVSSKAKLQEVLTHIEAALAATQQEISQSAKAFFDSCISHMHVLKHLPELFGRHEFPAEDYNVQVQAYADNPSTLNSRAPVTLDFGDGNIQSLVAIYECTPGYGQNISFQGKGYELKIGSSNTDGKINMNVVFPKYPHPLGE